MNFDKPITRRESIQKLLKLTGSLAVAGAVTWPGQKQLLAAGVSGDNKFIAEAIGQTASPEPVSAGRLFP